jgi:hypothetical protein
MKDRLHWWLIGASLLLTLGMLAYLIARYARATCPGALMVITQRVERKVYDGSPLVVIHSGETEYECVGARMDKDLIGIATNCPARDRLVGSKITLLEGARAQQSMCVVSARRDLRSPNLVFAYVVDATESVYLNPAPHRVVDEGIPPAQR